MCPNFLRSTERGSRFNTTTGKVVFDKAAKTGEVDITIDDPEYYTAPWTVTVKQPYAWDSELIDYYCLENEKDFVHMK